MQGRVGELGHLGDLRFPGGYEGVAIGFLPMASDHGRGRDRMSFGRTHQPDAILHVAVVGHHRGSVNLHGRPARPLIEEKPCTGIGEVIERGFQRQGSVAAALGDG